MGTPRHNRGFALLVVLWTLVLLALMVTHLTATGRSEARIAQNLVGGAGAQALADGAVYETIFRILDASKAHWAIDGGSHELKLDTGAATIRIISEGGKINPNNAEPELLSALLRVVGVDETKAVHIAAAIADWREPGDSARPNGAKAPEYRAAGLDYSPPGEPFQSLDELGRVLGMTPEILAALRPHLSIFELLPPDPAQADPIVKQALSILPGQNGIDHSAPDAVAISATVKTKSGNEFTRHAIVRLGPAFETGYGILEWN